MVSAPQQVLEKHISQGPAQLVREQMQLVQGLAQLAREQIPLVQEALLTQVLRQEQLVLAVLSVEPVRLNAHPDQRHPSWVSGYL
jgi:hypothetical protein